MAKMAELHAQQTDTEYLACHLCGDEVLVCDMLEECPGKHVRRAERLA